ncbi:MAG: SAM-dependent methyltransferase, partial [Bacteroidales bacterium]
MDKAALYLIPVLLGDTSVERVIPEFNKRIVSELKFFIVENIRSARRFMKKCDPGIDIDSLTFYELNKHTNKKDIEGYLAPMKSGNSMGVIS